MVSLAFTVAASANFPVLLLAETHLADSLLGCLENWSVLFLSRKL